MAEPRSVVCGLVWRLDRYLFLFWLVGQSQFEFPLLLACQKKARDRHAIVSAPLFLFDGGLKFVLRCQCVPFNSIFPMINAFSFPSIIVVTQSTIAADIGDDDSAVLL